MPRMPAALPPVMPTIGSASSFKALLKLLQEQHERELAAADLKAEDERKQLSERLAASEGESKRLRRHLKALEKDPLVALGVMGSTESDKNEEGESHHEDESPTPSEVLNNASVSPPQPCFVEAPPPPDIDEPKPLPPSGAAGSRRGSLVEKLQDYLFGHEKSDKSEKSNGTVKRKSNEFEENIMKFREECDKEEEEQKRLAQQYENGQRDTRPTSMYISDDLSPQRQKVLKMISHPIFDFAIGAIIAGNPITIGIETSYGKAGTPTPGAVAVFENIFLAIYVFELSARFYGAGILEALRSTWIKFDTFLVLCGLSDVVMRIVMGGESVAALEQVMLIRMLRLARLARTVRLLMQFRTLWLLVEGLLLSLMTLIWTFVIVFAITYVFAIAGMELIRPHDDYPEAYRNVANNNFDSLSDSMLTLVQFFTLDSIGGIYSPIIKEKPWMACYFFSFILVVAIALMNLITAIMVETSLRQANDDIAAKKAWEAQKKKELLPGMKRMFAILDSDGSGELDLEEIQNAPDFVKEQLSHICKMDDIEELFQLLDYDGSGVVDVDEFIEGIMKTTQDKPPELLRLMKQCSDISKRTLIVEQLMTGLTEKISSGKLEIAGPEEAPQESVENVEKVAEGDRRSIGSWEPDSSSPVITQADWA